MPWLQSEPLPAEVIQVIPVIPVVVGEVYTIDCSDDERARPVSFARPAYRLGHRTCTHHRGPEGMGSAQWRACVETSAPPSAARPLVPPKAHASAD